MLSEVLQELDKRTKKYQRLLEVYNRYGDCMLGYKKFDYWLTTHICIEGTWQPLALHKINHKFHCSSLINYETCSYREWQEIFYNL